MSAARKMPPKRQRVRALAKLLDSVPDQRDEDECLSCDGYGHIRPNGEGTIDRRERKCLDCSGSGKQAAESSSKAGT